jgi:hypothetical protein
MDWRNRGQEFTAYNEEQADPDPNTGPADLVHTDAAIQAMGRAPLGDPPVDYDVRAVFDSRFPNCYDFNIAATSGSQSVSAGGVSFTFALVAPAGYRAIPREWRVQIDNYYAGPTAGSTATILINQQALPFNTNIIIGAGTGSIPIKTFFLVEEGQQFGLLYSNANAGTGGPVIININCYGNLIAVTDVQLPYADANPRR